jgi:hypothetical protein
MKLDSYQDLRRISAEIAGEVGNPRFNQEKSDYILQSRSEFEASAAVGLCLEIAGMDHFAGHGGNHIRRVAVDAGAIVLIEANDLLPGSLCPGRLMVLAHLAGVLHDVKRSGPDHARLGAIEAGRILDSKKEEIAIGADERLMIEQAIANHEAFQPSSHLERPDAQLLSDALYDADKFRWGPENFTDTLWDLLEARGGPENIPGLFKRFSRGLEGIERIKQTFRTRTGKAYGPDFIDRGLAIGQRLLEVYGSERS